MGRSRARLLCGALLGVALTLAAGSAAAQPLIAGCCDSITSSNPSGSYLDFLWDEYGWPDPWEPHNLGQDASPSSSGLSRIETYLTTYDPDAVIVLSGTPDAFWASYQEAETVGNIEGMVLKTLNDGAEPVLVAPPPVFEPCTGNGGLSCQLIDDRLYDLSLALDDLAFQEDVAFVDLYALFDTHPDPGSLYFADGIHPDHTEGDLFIADTLIPELAEILCGNGILDPGETCDDGNNIPGDGCPATCGVAADCLDGVDNDGDGTVDFGEDFGCDSPYDPSEGTSPGVIACDDGVDNDGDNLTDFPADPGCGNPLGITENPQCQDGIDNDGDGRIDYGDDPGCDDADDVSERSDALPCDNGLDDDGDGRIDFDPVTRANPGDQNNSPSGVGDPGCGAPSWHTESPQCQDGVQNDGDAWMDYDGSWSVNGGGYYGLPPDPQCIAPWWNSEAPWSSPCGLGVELALLLPPLMWMWRRRNGKV